MTGLAVLMLARHAGQGFEAQAADVATLARPGDRVVVVADDAAPETAFRTGRFLAQSGFGPGVAAERILTGTAGDEGPGQAIALGLQALGPPGTGPARLVILGPGTRLDAPGFRQARAHAEAADLDLLAFALRQWSPDLGRVLDGPDLAPAGGVPQDALSLAPGLDGMILRRSLLDTGAGPLSAWWRAHAHARRAEVWPQPLGHRGAVPEPDAGLFLALTDLVGICPEAAAWARAALPRLIAGHLPGAVTGLLAAGPALARALGRDTPLLDALASPDPGAARQALRRIADTDPVPARFPQPAGIGQARLRVHLTGSHSHRTPLAYPHLAPLWEDAAVVTEDAGTADLIVIAHPHNAARLPAATVEATARAPLALVSEEPFWDTLFSPDPLAHKVRLGALNAHQVNHHRSAIYRFDRIPYYLLTDPGYIARYAALFARNARLSAQDWQTAFAARPTDVAFMAERRPEAFHNIALPQGDILGLCAWRTELALACTQGAVARIGASWGNGPSRFDLSDWHGDKLSRLDGRTRILSGIENTHQPTYLSEKLFDAFACGALPLYLASPGHRVHDLGLPPGSWLNLWGLTPDQAAERVEGAEITPGLCADYATAQGHLAALFTDAGILAAERTRLGRAITHELRRLAGLGPA